MSASSISCCAVRSAATIKAVQGYEIRPAVADDAEPLYRFGEALLSESSYFLRSPGERARSVGEMRAVIERFHELPTHLLIGAWHDGVPIGEAVAIGGDFKRDRYAATIGVGVLAAHSGQGLGYALMRDVETFARDRSLRRLELTVMAHNTRARALYDRMGYVTEGVKRESLFVDGAFVDEILMAKLLD
jgi:RimJ/RimL family protein N-acetyltransferase